MTIACPGPVATGTEGAPRNVFGASALTAKYEERGGLKKRLSPQRVAALIACAAYNRLDMAWIARHPVLLLGACHGLLSCASLPAFLWLTHVHALVLPLQISVHG